MESPIPRRLSSSISIPAGASRVHDIESVINSYEAEEERIVNVLSRKLEQLRDEKIQLENILEAESESHFSQSNQGIGPDHPAAHAKTTGHYDSDGQSQSVASSPVQHFHAHPHHDSVSNSLRRENDLLRTRLVDYEHELMRISKLNEIYFEEILELRRRLGLPLDGLLSPQASADPYSQSRHHRRESSTSPVISTVALPQPQRPSPGPLPIHRPPSQIHRPTESQMPNTSIPTSASSPDSSTPASPFPFSPLSSSLTSAAQTGYQTTLTTPASVPPLTHIPPTMTNPTILTYPHVPPPSLSSSLGSPVAMFSPVNSTSRRNSRVTETGSLVRRGSRGSSVDRHSRPIPTGYPSTHGSSSIAEQLSQALTPHAH